jgi:hypothetical protein
MLVVLPLMPTHSLPAVCPIAVLAFGVPCRCCVRLGFGLKQRIAAAVLGNDFVRASFARKACRTPSDVSSVHHFAARWLLCVMSPAATASTFRWRWARSRTPSVGASAIGRLRGCGPHCLSWSIVSVWLDNRRERCVQSVILACPVATMLLTAVMCLRFATASGTRPLFGH